jgi:hypothetical protein
LFAELRPIYCPPDAEDFEGDCMATAGTSAAERLAAQFPGPVRLHPSPKKWLLVLLGCAAFAVIGFFMIRDGQAWGWLVLVFFGAGAPIAAAMLWPGANGLTLDRDGFEVANALRRHRSRWQDTTGFESVAIPPAMQKLVCYDDTQASGMAMATVNAGITGHTSALPDTYGLSAEELAALMAWWRMHALTP